VGEYVSTGTVQRGSLCEANLAQNLLSIFRNAKGCFRNSSGLSLCVHMACWLDRGSQPGPTQSLSLQYSGGGAGVLIPRSPETGPGFYQPVPISGDPALNWSFFQVPWPLDWNRPFDLIPVKGLLRANPPPSWSLTSILKETELSPTFHNV
jgi:hypothetical protein